MPAALLGRAAFKLLSPVGRRLFPERRQALAEAWGRLAWIAAGLAAGALALRLPAARPPAPAPVEEDPLQGGCPEVGA